MLARCKLWPRVCLCLSEVGVQSERLKELSWFLAWRLPSTHATLCHREIQVSTKNKGMAYLPLELRPKVRTSKISPRTTTTVFCTSVGLAMVSQCTKFEVSRFSHYDAMNGGAKCRKWGSLGQLGGTQGHRQCHHSIQRIRLHIRL